ncbi:MAG: C1 family peptidase [Bacteroidales bacterium]|jgi:bleomycin hydrolase|nr:C1 family peptidase [Bacteroidales bacterium]MDD4384128.1 C1 family peptidase [Bacteroidales bacterium]MDY0197180.1 C1 family peptidase [Tenuifilaceae bacterium]
MKQLITTFFAALLLSISSFIAIAQEEEGYKFEVIKEIKTTPVKDQQRTGTCWSFATTSFLETEIIRMGKPQIVLSPMYFVKHTYANKAKRFVRFQGANNFGQGGQAHDALTIIATHGMVPENEFSGINYDEDVHVHSELAAVLNGFLEAVVKNPNRKLSTAWEPAFNSILDAYFGDSPKEFTVEGKNYTPHTLAEGLDIDVENYIELTSYTHHPFYQQIILEIPDNWAHKAYYNIPLDELMAVMLNAINKGYSICWDGDVSEKGFVHRKGLAVLPQVKVTEMTDSEQGKWADVPMDELMSTIYSFNKIVPEIKVTQDLRQQTFDNYTTTDDHLMHLVGISKDQEGNQYYITKNSWGSSNHIYNGYLHMSEQYVRMKTTSIMVHKDALPKELAKKLGLMH